MEWRPLQLCNMLAPGMRLNSEGPVSPLNFLPHPWASEGSLLTVIRSQWQSPCSHPLPLLGGLADNHCDLGVAGRGLTQGSGESGSLYPSPWSVPNSSWDCGHDPHPRWVPKMGLGWMPLFEGVSKLPASQPVRQLEPAQHLDSHQWPQAT